MTTTVQIADVLRLINTAGVIGVLVIGLWLGLRGDVVTAEQLRDCRMARDAYLRDLLRINSAPDPIPGLQPPARQLPE